jgi:hypothetical protein
MDLCLITIGAHKFAAAEIDLLHVLMEDDDGNWSIGELGETLPYVRDDMIACVENLLQCGILQCEEGHTTDLRSSEDIDNIKVTVTIAGRSFLDDNTSDIDDAFIMLNPDLFDVTEVGIA